ncbi:unnamed protein product [Natator depressus]
MKGEAASGEPCHFSFCYQRKMPHSCLRDGLHGRQSWCATTKNYDRPGPQVDALWGGQETDWCGGQCKPK